MKKLSPSGSPFLLYSDDCGRIFEDKTLLASGKSANQAVVPNPESFIRLPEGSDFFHLPGRRPVGWNPKTSSFETCTKGWAVAAFVAPAYTIYYSATWETEKGAPRLPLYAYCALGWHQGKFYVPAERIDPDIRQDCNQFDQKLIVRNARKWVRAQPGNRLMKHVAHCATVYLCPAARNYFHNRWEAPLPTSPSCNSKCMGCISFQPKKNKISSTQNRITFVPTPDEIASIAIPHLETAPQPVVSFGQGCEGEPLMVWETIEEAIRIIRKITTKGIINLNTNGSKPFAIDQLYKAGLDSIRVSLNSSQEKIYNTYYNPVGYNFNDLVESLKLARKHNKWASLNYFVFPGMTDHPAEIESTEKLLRETSPNMIQWRNFNIDPEWYLEIAQPKDERKPIGIEKTIQFYKKTFPALYHGYFNPGEIIIQSLLHD